MNITTKNPVIYPIIVPTSSSLASINFYLVKNQDKLLLVDGGINTEKCWSSLNDVLEKYSFSFNDIDKIVLTHSHEDHTGVVNRILAIHKIPIYAHENSVFRLKRDWSFLKKRVSFFKNLYFKMGCGIEGEHRIDVLERKVKENTSQAINAEVVLLKEGDWLDGFRVIETPGHWPDHISLHHPETGQLLAGDHLIQHISSNALIEPDEWGRKIPTLLQYEKSLLECQKYNLSVVYPGHGDIIDKPSKLIEKRLKGIERKSEKVNDIIRRIQPCTAAQVAQSYYKEKYYTEFSLVMSEIIGHLDRLEILDKIEKREKGGVWHYFFVND